MLKNFHLYIYIYILHIYTRVYASDSLFIPSSLCIECLEIFNAIIYRTNNKKKILDLNLIIYC